jgi:PASTA domain
VTTNLRRFGWLGIALAAAGGFLAGVMLIAILGGAKPVVKTRTHTRTVATRPVGIAVPNLSGVHLDQATARLQAVGLRADPQGGGLFGFGDESGWVVVGQDPSPGSRVMRGDSVSLEVDRS